ncbi:MAG: VOC family protein [Proteobacteria bacterium]|nr:VOC family protein [Pseudomonadota bacterium]
MKPISSYPVIACENVAETAGFYIDYFAFRPVFESDWYVHLRSASVETVNLAIMDCRHETIPEGYRKPVQGLLINFEIDDVDGEYDRVKSAGLPILQPLRSEDFGQRHFITRDPAGVMVDVIKVIPPGTEFAAQYRDGGAG